MRASSILYIYKRWKYLAHTYQNDIPKTFFKGKVDEYTKDNGLEDRGATTTAIK